MQQALTVRGMIGRATSTDGAPWLKEGRLITASDPHDGVEFSVVQGSLRKSHWLACDMLSQSDDLIVFRLQLREAGDNGGMCRVEFRALPHAQARLRIPLTVTDQNQWLLAREGALLKPVCGGDVIDPANVVCIQLIAVRKADGPVSWEQTPICVCDENPAKLTDPLLPRGALTDALGQAAWRDWPGKTRGETELTERLQSQYAAARDVEPEKGRSRRGGWTEQQYQSTGWFRTEKDGNRWWLVDPDGCAFWSAGCDVVRPGTPAACDGLEKALAWTPAGDPRFEDATDGGNVNFLVANLIRAFGPDAWYERWGTLAVHALRSMGFNTVGNWSNTDVARHAHFPYVLPMRPTWRRARRVFRDFPDVFDNAFEEDAADFADQLRETRDDPAMIGYFLMNEPNWGFAHQTPAEGMLYNTEHCRTREALAEYLAEKYASGLAWADAWEVEAALDDVAGGRWQYPLNDTAKHDLARFSTIMVKRLYDALSAACARVDPYHLNLGARYYIPPPEWAVAGMDSFDVFSINGYGKTIRHEEIAGIVRHVDRPVMIGEWHFGALDAGLPATGIGRVATQGDRGRAYRYYLEDAAEDPNCVGVHWFILYDQPALGRGDGEPYNIGMLDICHRPYTELAGAARQSHERMYDVRACRVAPYNSPPTFYEPLF